MLNENLKTPNSEPTLTALIAAVFVWIVFDSFFFGMIAGFIAYLAVQKNIQKDTE